MNKIFILSSIITLFLIHNTTAYTVTGNVVATDGSQVDCTNAWNYVQSQNQDGWSITLPDNSSNVWAGYPLLMGSQYSINFGGAHTNNRPTIVFAYTNSYGIFLENLSNGHITTIQNLILFDTPNISNNDIGINGHGVCFRITNVKWVNTQANNAAFCGSINSDTVAGPYGLFDHDELSSDGGSFYGIFVTDNGSYIHNGWTRPMTWGTTNAVYFEDCSAHAVVAILGRSFVDGDGGAREVIRNCNLTNYVIGFHGYDSGAGDGTLQTEIYNNNLYCNDTINGMSYMFWQRGGTTAIWSNNIGESVNQLIAAGIWKFTVDCASAANWSADHCARQLLYPADYPATQQIGRGVVSGSEGWVPAYIWGNNIVSTYYGEFLNGYGDGDQSFINVNNNIYENNGAMPGYTPLIYPHPLVGISSPTPPPIIIPGVITFTGVINPISNGSMSFTGTINF